MKTVRVVLTLPVQTVDELRARGAVPEMIRAALRVAGYVVPDVVPGNPALRKDVPDGD